MNKLEKQLYEALDAAREHLEYCGYGDKWERSCALPELPKQIEAALTAAKSKKKSNWPIRPVN